MAVNYMEEFDFSLLEHYISGGAVLPSHDQYMGKLVSEEESASVILENRVSISYRAGGYDFMAPEIGKKENVVVILESPHRYEYDEKKEPIGLAMGKTGDNFFLYFRMALAKGHFRFKAGEYNLIFINAVQYQASCGLIPIDRKIRNANWLDIYKNHGGRDDFKWRLLALDPAYVINLCTGGKNPLGLRQIVSDTVLEMGFCKGIDFTEGTHPSSWEHNGNTDNAIIE